MDWMSDINHVVFYSCPMNNNLFDSPGCGVYRDERFIRARTIHQFSDFETHIFFLFY